MLQRPWRRHRRDRAARRQEPGRARASGSARAGVRPPRRHRASLRGRARPISPRPKKSCSTPKCGAPASAARPKPCWWIAPGRTRCWRRWSKPCSTPAARCAATRRPRRGCARKTGERTGLVHRISRSHHFRKTGGRRSGRDRPHRELRLAPHRRHRHRKPGRRRKNSSERSIPPSSSTTPPPSSPMAANSVSARKSASPRGGCMRAARSAWRNSRRSNMSCTATGRRARDKTAAARAGHDHRPVRRLVQPAARGPSSRRPHRAAPRAAGRALGDGDARQPPEKPRASAAVRATLGGGQDLFSSPSCKSHGFRGGARRALFLADRRISAAPRARCKIRVDHGRRQSRGLPPLAALARHRKKPADPRGGPAGRHPQRRLWRRRRLVRALAAAGGAGAPAFPPPPAGAGAAARAALGAFVDAIAPHEPHRRGRRSIRKLARHVRC